MKNRLTIICLVIAAIFGAAFVAFALHSGSRYVAVGAEPTAAGISSIVVSLLGACGFSVVGIANAILQRFIPGAPNLTQAEIDEIKELTEAFFAWKSNTASRAAQRRLMFAAAEEFKHIPGISVSHDNGVLTVSYSGYIENSPQNSTVDATQTK